MKTERVIDLFMEAKDILEEKKLTKDEKKLFKSQLLNKLLKK